MPLQDELPDELAAMLPGLPYIRGNCLSACRQQHMLALCNCTLDFIFPVGRGERQCRISDFECLFKNDSESPHRASRLGRPQNNAAYLVCADVLNYEKPPANNPYFDASEAGMECSCPPECQQLDYSVQISAKAGPADAAERIELDVHFEQATMVQYRTSLVFDWMDLMGEFRRTTRVTCHTEVLYMV